MEHVSYGEAHPETKKNLVQSIESVVKRKCTVEGRTQEYLTKYQEMLRNIPEEEKDKVEEELLKKLEQKAKLTLLRDGAIVVGVIIGGILIYKNRDHIVNGILNIKENLEPLERKSPEEWVQVLREKGDVAWWRNLPFNNKEGDREFEVGGKKVIGIEQGLELMSSGLSPQEHGISSHFDHINPPYYYNDPTGLRNFYNSLGADTLKDIVMYTRMHDTFRGSGARGDTYAIFSTLQSPMYEHRRVDSKTMGIQYNTLWNSLGFHDQRGPFIPQILNIFLPRKLGKQLARQSLEDPALLEQIMGKVLAGFDTINGINGKPLERIPVDTISFIDTSPRFTPGRLLGSAKSITKSVDRKQLFGMLAESRNTVIEAWKASHPGQSMGIQTV